MIEESDWQTVYHELIAERRAELGEPPTAEEVEALFNDQLSEEDAARVRQLLVVYPEMARVMTQPDPPEDVKILTPVERAEDWAKIRNRISRPGDRPRRPPRILAYAAGIALLLAGAAAVYLLTRPSANPTNGPAQIAHHKTIEHYDLWPDGVVRGGAAPTITTLSGKADEYVLKPLSSHERQYDDYRIEIDDLDAKNATVWSRAGLRMSPDGSFEITVSNQVLKPGGHYRLLLRGISAGHADLLATYTIRLK